jgi:translation elongation factor EF-4
MKEKEISQKSKSSKMNFTLKSEKTSYNFNLIDKEGELTFKFQNLNEFPIKIY